MKDFISALTSEYYKSRKSLNFWAAILLPTLICTLEFVIFFIMADKFEKLDGKNIWDIFSGSIIAMMGNLLLPLFVIFLANSVNSLEHKADTWKTLFSLPISKWTVYTAKLCYSLILLFTCVTLFAFFIIGYGNVLGFINPHLKFNEYHMEGRLLASFFKLFLSCLGILSIQFLLSFIWSDFLKPMGIGIIFFIIGVIVNTISWRFAYLIPYANPALTVKTISNNPNAKSDITISIFSSEIIVSLIFFAAFMLAGYYFIRRKRIK